jgi:hypothetical protein
MNCKVPREVRVVDQYPCREGDVVAVRVLKEKSTYNQVELCSGRMSTLKKGDVLVGALGHRNALGGFAGRLPSSVKTGDTINVLNLGGVLGICTSFNPSVGSPLEVEVLGQVLHFPYLGERIGIPANISQGAHPMTDRLDVAGVPVVAVVGTCMNAGKTFACSSLIQEFTHAGLKVHAMKCTGVSLRRDVLSMEDAGASRTMVFTDLGVVTTTGASAPGLARTMLTSLADGRPDVIVAELGAGILSTYGVAEILAAADIRSVFRAVVLAANDPVGAWGGVERLQRDFHLATSVVTGPTTDNTAGTEIIEKETGVRALNARTSASELAAHVLTTIGVVAPGGGRA